MHKWLPALVAVSLAYYLYIPIPSDNAVDFVKVHVYEICMRVVYFYPMSALKFCGSHWQLWWARTSLRILVKFVSVRYWLESYSQLKVSEATFNGVPVVIYDPVSRRPGGAVVFIHGGGFVLFDAVSYDTVMRRLTIASGFLTIAVDYRNAPEHVFPAAVDDCERATRHLLTKAWEKYDVDPSRVAVVGDSAGGNLAAVSVLRIMHDTTEMPKPKLQVLIYPLLQFVDFRTPSYQAAHRLYGGSSLADPESVARWYLLYIGMDNADVNVVLKNGHLQPDSVLRNAPFLLEDMKHELLPFSNNSHSALTVDDTSFSVDYHSTQELHAKIEQYIFNPDASPMVRTDLDLSPKTFMITVEYDPLRDEGYWYMKRLERAGVDVAWRHYQHAFHGIIGLHADIQLGAKLLNDTATFLINNL